MICDLLNLTTPKVRRTPKARIELMRLKQKLRVFIKAILNTEDMNRAELLRRAIKVTQRKMELIQP